MKTYSGLHALYMSFFSKDLYRSVVRNWKGIAFLYLFLLIMSSWALIAVKVYFVMNQAMTGPVKKIIDKLPMLTIHDGELKIDKPSPYIVYMPLPPNSSGNSTQQQEMPIVAFDDTTDDVKGLDNVPFLMTKHYYYTGKSSEAQQTDLKQLGEQHYTKQNYKEIADAINLWVPIVVFCVCGPLFFICSAVIVLICGAIGLAVAGGTNIKLTYGEAVRIAAVAFTPSVFFDTVLKLGPVPQMPVWMIVPLVLALAYTIFGVMSNKDPIIVETSMPGGMPSTSDSFSPDDDVPPAGQDKTTPMT